MSQYKAQFISTICCCSLHADEYISDMILDMKSRIWKLTADPFSLHLTVQDHTGEKYLIETDETKGFSCPEELIGKKCTELAVEVSCKASCDQTQLKDAMHQAIADSSGIYNMTPFFFREDSSCSG